MKLKNMKVRKIGSSYGILIPRAIVEDTDLIDTNKKYTINLEEVKDGLCGTLARQLMDPWKSSDIVEI